MSILNHCLFCNWYIVNTATEFSINIFKLILYLCQLPQDQIIRWHVWNTEKQIEQMVEKSVELVRFLLYNFMQ